MGDTYEGTPTSDAVATARARKAESNTVGNSMERTSTSAGGRHCECTLKAISALEKLVLCNIDKCVLLCCVDLNYIHWRLDRIQKDLYRSP